MKKRKQVVIDKKFQHGKSIAITSFAAVITAIIVISVGFSIHVNNGRIKKNNVKLSENTSTINSIISNQQNIFINYSLLPRDEGALSRKEKTSQMVKEYNANVEKLNSAVKSNQEIAAVNMHIMTMNTGLVIAIILITVLGMGLLYWRLIHETHRVSGPVFLMSRHIREILDGDTPDMRDLRDNDEFKEFYELFREMAGKLIEYQKKS